jgi:phosphoribosylanthranilate isomerase
MRTVKIKICGITNPDDAMAAVDAGADALGFVFYKSSPRYVHPDVVRRMVASLPPFVLPVGVFVNEDLTVVQDVIDSCGLAVAQLHGEETAAYCEQVGRPVWKAIRLKNSGGFLALAEYKGRAGVRALLIDAYSASAHGGTGQKADWALAAEAARTAPVLLAGGLTPENVGDAIRMVKPYGVDVSSGVEASPGKKDHHKVTAFIQAVTLVSASD